ncbi:maleylpyruvate isomerase N-terminal domain-containing protein [Leucobacter sp. wl10]|uniref:maleylpyruvate isomerase N-terminal domain-containing protein n=1 Tax=Leucobacter sp. wl10 TaxID=2304677 RepID=UPI000E5B4C4F|nr:maleylpyruvate isomerase N-terminal domain-containing protein [Leucobacter sp. wl10]RGE18966.1 maleylpyruvate isomerase family mycothiol-dependent enzyme [Leucobacter sp. wl10]
MAARTDNVDDPVLARALLLMRRGQAFWARELRQVEDEGFDAPSLLPGWTRRMVVAHVGFNARALARLVRWARTGIETPMYESEAQRAREIEFGASLPAEALRHLSVHAAVHLNVELRDLPSEAWSRTVRTAQGREVPVSEVVWMRTREVWLHAIDLAHGARFDDLPPRLLQLLLEDIPAVWARRRAAGDPVIRLAPDDARLAAPARGAAAASDTDAVVRGSAAALVAWGTGRGAAGVREASGRLLQPPRWL